MKCSCPDYAVPYKHISAVLYVLGDTIDEDPFLLLKLKGKTKEEIIKAMSGSGSAKESADMAEPSLKGDPEFTEPLKNFWKPSRAVIPIAAKTNGKSLNPMQRYPLPSDFDDETVSIILKKYYEDIMKGLERMNVRSI